MCWVKIGECRGSKDSLASGNVPDEGDFVASFVHFTHCEDMTTDP